MFGNYIRSMPKLGAGGSSNDRKPSSAPKHSRGPSGTAKATSSTRCQRCLKFGHFISSCPEKTAPYVSRPSRTQQLLKPEVKKRLQPTVDVPEEFLSKKGVADKVLERNEKERLAKQAEEAGRKKKKASKDDGSSSSSSDSDSDSDSDSSDSSSSSSDSSSSGSSRSRSPPRNRRHARSRSNSPSTSRSPARRRGRSVSSERGDKRGGRSPPARRRRLDSGSEDGRHSRR